MRLIDGDALKEMALDVLERIKANPKFSAEERHVIAAFAVMCDMIDDAPTIDAEPRCCRTCNWWVAVEEGGLCMDDLTVKYPNDDACKRWRRGEEAGQ